MGIESEQLVYDYLSRVGDLAGQSGGLTAAQRARLVNELRQTIDSQRAGVSPSTTRGEVNSVRRILAGLGTPDEVVHRAAAGGGRADSGPAVPAQTRSSAPTTSASSGATPLVPAQDRPSVVEGRVEFVNLEAIRPLGSGAPWWSGESETAVLPGTSGVRMVQLPGWSGSFDGDDLTYDASAVIHPLTGLPVAPPPPGSQVGSPTVPGALPGSLPEGVPQAAPQGRRGLVRRLLGAPVPGAPAAARVARGPLPFVESLATVVLLGALVTGLWYVALLGWLLAYAGRRFGHGVGRFAALWIPGLVAAACGFWLYTRSGHTPAHAGLTNTQFAAATHNAFAFWLRAASGLSAAFLAWRITRR